MEKICLFFLVSIFCFFSSISYADTSSSSGISSKSDQKISVDLPDLTTTYPPQPQYQFLGMTVTSYIAGSYNYLSTSDLYTSGVPNRLFDRNDNGFTLQQAVVTIAKQPEQGLGFLINPVVGSDANILTPYGMTSLSDSDNLGLDFWNLYLQYAYKKLTVIAGRFVSLAGVEYPETILNTNFSSSTMGYFMQPGTVLGARGTYAVTDKLNLIAGINNGWDNIRDLSRRKTLELGGQYIDPKYAIYFSFYNGQERATPFTSTGPIGVRTLYDLIAQYNATDNLAFIINYDYLTQTKATLANGTFGSPILQGIAGYVNYKFNDKWRISVRSDFFDDGDGFATGVRQALKELTITVGYNVLKHLELRAEGRNDFSNTNAFLEKNYIQTTNNQKSFALEAVWAI